MNSVIGHIKASEALRQAQEQNAKRQPSLFRDLNAQRLAGLQAERRAAHEEFMRRASRRRL